MKLSHHPLYPHWGPQVSAQRQRDIHKATWHLLMLSYLWFSNWHTECLGQKRLSLFYINSLPVHAPKVRHLKRKKNCAVDRNSGTSVRGIRLFTDSSKSCVSLSYRGGLTSKYIPSVSQLSPLGSTCQVEVTFVWSFRFHSPQPPLALYHALSLACVPCSLSLLSLFLVSFTGCLLLFIFSKESTCFAFNKPLSTQGSLLSWQGLCVC